MEGTAMTYLRAIRQPRRWIVTGALLASLAGLVLSQVGAADAAGSASAVGPAAAGAATSNRGSKPTVVLVHGAWADSGSWDQVVARLQRQGYTVIAFPNPLRGLPDDSAYLAAFLSTISGPIVLVGHSYGGAVITNAATGNANVKALV
jgi:pimeloyl-ACP methyl ester carboxylesterase